MKINLAGVNVAVVDVAVDMDDVVVVDKVRISEVNVGRQKPTITEAFFVSSNISADERQSYFELLQ